MKLRNQLLMAGAIAMMTATSVATASSLLDAEIFSASYGEVDYFNESSSHSTIAQRVNFDFTPERSGALHHVDTAPGYNGEYDGATIDGMRVNYSITPSSLGAPGSYERDITNGVFLEY